MKFEKQQDREGGGSEGAEEPEEQRADTSKDEGRGGLTGVAMEEDERKRGSGSQREGGT